MRRFSGLLSSSAVVVALLTLFDGVCCSVGSTGIDLEALVRAMEANLEKLQSGKGELTWRKNGEYFGADWNQGKGFTATFAFDRDKVRYDRTFFNQRRHPHKEAMDGEHWFRTIGDYSAGRPDAYIEPLENFDRDNSFWGEVVDIKRLMQFWVFRNDEILQGIQMGVVRETVSLQPDGTFEARIRFDEDADEYVLWFDPSQGYNIVREQYFYKGHQMNDMQRTFEKVDGIWVLKTLDWTRYKLDSGEVDGKTNATIGDMEINSTIPDTTFDLEGFGLPSHARVIDEEKGISYTLDPLTALADTANTLLSEAADMSSEITSFTAMETNPSVQSEVPEISNGGGTIKSAAEEERRNRAGWWIVAVLAVAMFAGIVGFLFRSRLSAVRSKVKRS